MLASFLTLSCSFVLWSQWLKYTSDHFESAPQEIWPLKQRFFKYLRTWTVAGKFGAEFSAGNKNAIAGGRWCADDAWHEVDVWGSVGAYGVIREWD